MSNNSNNNDTKEQQQPQPQQTPRQSSSSLEVETKPSSTEPVNRASRSVDRPRSSHDTPRSRRSTLYEAQQNVIQEENADPQRQQHQSKSKGDFPEIRAYYAKYVIIKGFFMHNPKTSASVTEAISLPKFKMNTHITKIACHDHVHQAHHYHPFQLLR